ncbi:hypothetical protein RJ640_002083 [Escallonia rubra]|uniref:Retrotransposon gag domain-containing protein n=1 Tax=Escallonia rubra TaxID=112253 RepID=A0AA88R4J5_9ASTE|nr:hypothetical protein RJ640_002083 [Escallonia rubra]
MENALKSATVRSSNSSASTGLVTRSRARDEMVAPNQVMVPASKPPVKPRVQFREVVVSRYEKYGAGCWDQKSPTLSWRMRCLHHHFNMPLMQTPAQEQLATMSRAFEKLTKIVEEKDFQIATLMNKLELQANEESNRGEVNEASKKRGANGSHDEFTFDGYAKEDKSNSVASLSVQQLQDMITSTIWAQYGGPSCNNLMYSKPYTKSLKGNAFDWYTDIEPESIDCWEAMEREFLNWFYSTRRSVSMMELTNTRHWKDEPVVDYINRWRSLSLDCKERLLEISTVEMCMQGMHWGLLYILQGNRPTSFEELATRFHDMEISIANHGGNSPALPDPRKERREGKKVERSSKMTGKESLAVTTAPLKVPKKDKHKEEKAPEHLQEKYILIWTHRFSKFHGALSIVALTGSFLFLGFSSINPKPSIVSFSFSSAIMVKTRTFPHGDEGDGVECPPNPRWGVGALMNHIDPIDSRILIPYKKHLTPTPHILGPSFRARPQALKGYPVDDSEQLLLSSPFLNWKGWGETGLPIRSWPTLVHADWGLWVDRLSATYADQ